jgi:protein-tyrosine phosphatase
MVRGVTFEKVFNFRDLGGYETADGRHVTWNRLYRADDLSRLNDADSERFAGLGIRTVVDLRRPEEVEIDGRIPQFDGFVYRHVHLVHPLWPQGQFTNAAERVEYLVERYRELSTDAAAGFGEALRLIADPGAAPLVFHCIAGKDRTGILAALTLSLLGVADDDVADDYALSEKSERAYWEYRRRLDPTVTGERNFVICPREAMLGFFSDLRTRHGSIEGYAHDIGVTKDDIAAMRDHLLTL